MICNCAFDNVRSIVGWTRGGGDVSLWDLSTFNFCDFLFLGEFIPDCLFFCPLAG